MMFSDPVSVIHLVERIAAVGVVISSLELLAQSRHLRDDGLLGWPISQLRHPLLARGFVGRLLSFFFAYPAFLGLVALRLLAASALLLLPPNAGQVVLTSAIGLLSFALTLRSPFGLDGADQMTTFLFCTLALTYLCPHPLVQRAFLWFLALQSCLSYITAGVAKAVSDDWRGGAAILGVSSTRMYGSAPVADYLGKHPVQCLWLCRSVILTECLFPLSMVVPRPVAVLFLLGGAAFHAGTAVFMGLNTFLWAFLATYPAILYCSGQLYRG